MRNLIHLGLQPHYCYLRKLHLILLKLNLIILKL